MIKIRPKPEVVPLSEIVKWAISGDLGVPEFQRKFDWSRRDIEELLVSILKGYYIGSFLFLRVSPENPPFAARPIQGTERLLSKKDDFKPRFLVLDGQQRITSIIYALYAPDPKLITPKYTSKKYLFFLDLKELENGNVDEAVFSYSEDYGRAKKLLEEKVQFEEKIIPLSMLRTKDSWHEWVERFKDYYRDKLFDELEDRDLIKKKLKELDKEVEKWNEYIQNLFNYPASVVYIPEIKPYDKEGLEQITIMFEKINMTGVKLSVFDLLNARLYLKGIRLHSLWEDTIQNHEKLAKLAEDNPDLTKILILRTIGLLRIMREIVDGIRSEISNVKNRSLINLSSVGFDDDWNIAAKYMEKALERIMSTNVDGFGAFAIKWIPYKAMIPVFATYLYYVENKLELSKRAYALRILMKWYWASVFSERYSGSPENTSLEDLKELIESVIERKEPELVKKAITYVSEELNMRKVCSRSSAIYKGIMNLVVLSGAKDFLYGESITFHELEDHHIFPQNYLARKLGIKDKGLINTILNRTLISEKTNKYIQDKAPSEYLKKVEEIGDLYMILEPHFIPRECIEFMRSNDYYNFLECRERAIKNKILEILTG